MKGRTECKERDAKRWEMEQGRRAERGRKEKPGEGNEKHNGGKRYKERREL